MNKPFFSCTIVFRLLVYEMMWEPYYTAAQTKVSQQIELIR